LILGSLYEHEKTNRDVYDNIREYCAIEQVDEEYLRSSIRKNGSWGKPVKNFIILAALLFSVCILVWLTE